MWGRFVMDTDCRLCWCVSCLLQCCTTQTVWGVIVVFAATPSSVSKFYFLNTLCILHMSETPERTRGCVCLGVMIWIHFTPHVSCLTLNTSAHTLVQMCLNFALNCKHKHTHKVRERHTCTHAYVCFGAHCHTLEAKNAVAQHWHLIWIRCCYCLFVCVQSAFSPPTTTFLSI